jgi:1-deoxy-D-xylulose 5-phosphate reductoisomerase
MRHPILSALAWPEVVPNQLEPLALDRLLDMRFEPPRYDDFPLLPLARRAAGMGGAYTIAYNASNEEAVAAFIEDRIGFLELAEVTRARPRARIGPGTRDFDGGVRGRRGRAPRRARYDRLSSPVN